MWREPKDHLEVCHFFEITIKGYTAKNKSIIKYPSILSAIRPIAHSPDVPPNPIKLGDHSDTPSSQNESSEYKEGIEAPQLSNQEKLNDLVKDQICQKMHPRF